MAAPTVTVRFWAGARRAAGHAEESIRAATLGEVRAALRDRHELTALVRAATLLVDGQTVDDATRLDSASVIDVLPPFAGGAG